MTDILEYDNEVIIYDETTLYEKWLDDFHGDFFFTNRELMNSPELQKEYDWFNPFEMSPQEIAERRDRFSKAKDWREYVELYFPNLDPKEEYKIKREENDREKIEMCGRYFTVCFSENNGGATPGRFRCGLCDDCVNQEAKAIRKAWLDVEQDNLRILTVPEKDRAKVTRQLRGMDKQTYLVEKDDGSIECQIVVATDDESIGETFNRFKFDYSQWAGSVIGKRQSGNLVENNQNIVRGTTKEEKEMEVLDEGKVLKAVITPKFDGELPEGIRNQREAVQAAIDYAIAQTEHYAPKSIDEIQTFIRARERLMIEAVNRMNGVIYCIEYKYGTMYKVTEDTAKAWQKYAKKPRRDQWKGLIE